jgi:hypothetical protein
MLSHRQYTHALRNKRLSGPCEAQGSERVNFTRKCPVVPTSSLREAALTCMAASRNVEETRVEDMFT